MNVPDITGLRAVSPVPHRLLLALNAFFHLITSSLSSLSPSFSLLRHKK